VRRPTGKSCPEKRGERNFEVELLLSSRRPTAIADAEAIRVHRDSREAFAPNAIRSAEGRHRPGAGRALSEMKNHLPEV
jgi:hypothetical protein